MMILLLLCLLLAPVETTVAASDWTSQRNPNQSFIPLFEASKKGGTLSSNFKASVGAQQNALQSAGKTSNGQASTTRLQEAAAANKTAAVSSGASPANGFSMTRGVILPRAIEPSSPSYPKLHTSITKMFGVTVSDISTLEQERVGLKRKELRLSRDLIGKFDELGFVQGILKEVEIRPFEPGSEVAGTAFDNKMILFRFDLPNQQTVLIPSSMVKRMIQEGQIKDGKLQRVNPPFLAGNGSFYHLFAHELGHLVQQNKVFNNEEGQAHFREFEAIHNLAHPEEPADYVGAYFLPNFPHDESAAEDWANAFAFWSYVDPKALRIYQVLQRVSDRPILLGKIINVLEAFVKNKGVFVKYNQAQILRLETPTGQVLTTSRQTPIKGPSDLHTYTYQIQRDAKGRIEKIIFPPGLLPTTEDSPNIPTTPEIVIDRIQERLAVLPTVGATPFWRSR